MSRSIAFLLVSFLGIPSIAQIDLPIPQPRTIHEGYVISADGDTTEGFVEFKTLIANQFNVHFYNQKSDQKPSAKYKPKDLKGYRVGDLFYRSVPFSGKGFSRKETFMICIVEGPLSLYKWYYDESVMFDNQDVNEAFGKEEVMDVDLDDTDAYQYFGVRNREKPVDLSSVKFGMNFKKHMSKYLADYPILAEKISSKQEGYGYEDLERIITEYNRWYLDNRLSRD